MENREIKKINPRELKDIEALIIERRNHYRITPTIGQSITIFISFFTAALCVMWFVQVG